MLRFDAEDAASLVTVSPTTHRPKTALHLSTGVPTAKQVVKAAAWTDVTEHRAHPSITGITTGDEGRPTRCTGGRGPGRCHRLAPEGPQRRRLARLRVGEGQSVDLDALMAMRPADGAEWMLGVVRRVHKRASQPKPVALIADRSSPSPACRALAKEEMSVVVDGVDASQAHDLPVFAFCGRVRWHEVDPHARHPGIEHGRAAGCCSRPAAEHTIVLRHLIEQRGDYWATMEIAERSHDALKPYRRAQLFSAVFAGFAPGRRDAPTCACPCRPAGAAPILPEAINEHDGNRQLIDQRLRAVAVDPLVEVVIVVAERERLDRKIQFCACSASYSGCHSSSRSLTPITARTMPCPRVACARVCASRLRERITTAETSAIPPKCVDPDQVAQDQRHDPLRLFVARKRGRGTLSACSIPAAATEGCSCSGPETMAER
jgi:hypothetical protein